MIFVDTSVWLSLFAHEAEHHAVVQHWFDQVTDVLLTSDYVVDELLTLLRARGMRRYEEVAGAALLAGEYAELHYTDRRDIEAGWQVFQRFNDKAWSFTDCVSYAQMQRLGLQRAASLDHHFRQFGIVEVVPAIP